MSRRNFLNKTVRVPFRSTSSVRRKTAANYEFTEIDLNIAAFSGDRVAAFAPFYEYFRICTLHITLFNDCPGNTCFGDAALTQLLGRSHGLAFVPSASADFGAVTSWDDLMQFPDATYGPTHERQHLRLGPKQLYRSTPVKWYHTKTTGTPPVADSSAGTITYGTYQIFTTSSQSFSTAFLLIEGEIELKSPLDDALSLHHEIKTVVPTPAPSPVTPQNDGSTEQKGAPKIIISPDVDPFIMVRRSQLAP